LPRAFIAALPDAATRAQLVEYQGQMRPHAERLRWIGAADLHLTLRFLGDTSDARLNALQGSVDAVAQSLPAATLHVEQAALWPPRRSSVLVLELADEPAMQACAARLEQASVALGFAAEPRSFRAHVTLARGRSIPPTMLAALPRPPPTLRFDRVGLFCRALPTMQTRYRALHLRELAHG